MLTMAYHQFLSWTRCIQSTPSHPMSLRPILILSSYLCLGLLCGLFPSGFPTTILYAFLSSHACYIHHPSHPLFDHPNNIWWSVQVMKLLIMQSSLASLLGPNIPLRTLFSNTFNLFFP
jgi:hypothetical protein